VQQHVGVPQQVGCSGWQVECYALLEPGLHTHRHRLCVVPLASARQVHDIRAAWRAICGWWRLPCQQRQVARLTGAAIRCIQRVHRVAVVGKEAFIQVRQEGAARPQRDAHARRVIVGVVGVGVVCTGAHTGSGMHFAGGCGAGGVI